MIRLFRVSLPASVVALIVSEAVLAFGCYAAAFALLSDGLFDVYFLYEGGLERSAAVVASILLGIYFNDLYTEVRVLSRLRLMQQFCLVFGVAFLVQALLSYIQPGLILGRGQMMLGSGFALIVLPIWRMLFDVLLFRVLTAQRVLFLGHSGPLLDIVRDFAEKPQLAMASIGYLASQPAAESEPALGPWLGGVERLRAVYDEQRPDLIVVGFEERRGQMPSQELLSLRMNGARVEDVSTLYERILWRVSVRTLRPSQLLFSSELGPTHRNRVLQYGYSFLIALAACLVAVPLFVLVWLAVRLSSPGPAIYRQRRVGLHGRVFDVLKFRSMYIDAEARTGAVWAQKDDPRITPVGRWLRKLRLDELPQLFNVLRGDMTIVGPRPERPEFVKVLSEQIPFYGQRHTVMPGITGWAQINHKYGDTIEDTVSKLEYDLYYLKNLSFSLDLYIIFHTAKVMLLSRGSQ
jgi:sugar transferase (PEP-CTERM system associated)